MTGWLEKLRQTHEDAERSMEELVQEVPVHPTNPRHRMHHEHFLSQRVAKIRECKRKLSDMYNEPDAKRSRAAPASTIERDFKTRLHELRDYHKRFPDIVPETHAVERPSVSSLPVSFSSEERFGECLDLHELYQKFMLLPFNYELSQTGGKTGYGALQACKSKPIDYVNWIKRCTMFQNIPRKWKNEEYRLYLQAFRDYMVDFFERTQPLVLPHVEVLSDASEKFKGRWDAQEVKGWEEASSTPLPDREAGKKLTRGQRKLLNGYRIAELEDQVQKLYELAGDQVQATLRQLDRRETLTREELNAEERRAQDQLRKALESAAAGVTDADEDKPPEPHVPWNPRKLPLGWDGKPIPFWLYRLHGLNLKFTCEICRAEYTGPKAFDKHFQEGRHAFEMQRLRIPNTRHFHHVTRVIDAQALWAKMRTDSAWKQWRPEIEQEFEDSEGHVFNKKTFEDMRRQGLLV